MVSPTRLRRGFTLVELLVVIGIIAVLIGILLPTISRARKQANTTACMATLRNLGQAIHIYASENKGSVPYSYYTGGNPSGAAEAAGDGGSTVYVWWSVLRSYMRKGGGPDNAVVNPDGSTSSRFMKAFACPEGHEPEGGCDYGSNMVAMPEYNWERHPFSASIKNQVIKPAKLNQLYPDNILLFDQTEIYENPNADPYTTQYVCGYFVAGGSLSEPKAAYKRYRAMANPPLIGTASGLRNDKAIDPGSNKDASASVSDGRRGNIRWRHGKEDTANFLFTDGTVRSMGITKNFNLASNANVRGDVLHSYFRIKAPAGFAISG
jgi:prepilin-type N-terminal cleavage/methylation domain-containing protein